MGKKLHETRERLLHEGLALMSRDGMAGVTLGVLAELVGMSKSGVFAHFRSKDEVQIGLPHSEHERPVSRSGCL